MKKILLFLLTIIITFLMGCDFLPSITTTSTNTSTISTTTTTTTSNNLTGTTTSGFVTTSDGTVISTTTTDFDIDEYTYQTLFDNAVYKKFVIHFSRANFLKLIDDMENYNDLYGSYRDNTIQEVDIDYSDSLGNRMTLYEVGFRTKGNIFSRRLPVVKDNNGNIIGYQQVSFQLEFNETFNYLENSTQYKELKDRRAFDLEQLNFKYIREDDTSAVTEMMAYELYTEAGVVTSKASFAIIYFDIEGTEVPYGLFMLQEPIDDVFVKRYFGRNQDGSVGDLYKCVWQTEPAKLTNDYSGYSLGVSDYNEGYRKTYQLKTNKDTSNFSSFINFVDKLNNTSVINYQNVLEQILDIDPLLKAFAMGFLIGSPDDYRSDANNYYLYFYEGKAVYIPFDMDQCLGYGWDPYGNHGLNLDVLNYPPAQSYIGNSSDLPMAYNILQISAYKQQYLNYIIEYTNPTNGIFNYQDAVAEFYQVKALYEAEANLYNHLGVKNFSLESRNMTLSDYFAQKSTNARNSALSYIN
ncbi:MAG: CotH kinase family protein [Candidatus Izemoplasmatales bacterium]